MTYLGCVLDNCLTGEPMAMQVCTKVTSKLKLSYRKNRFPSKDFCVTHLFGHTLITRVRHGIQIEMRNIKTNCRFYKTSLGVFSYNWTAEK